MHLLCQNFALFIRLNFFCQDSIKIRTKCQGLFLTSCVQVCLPHKRRQTAYQLHSHSVTQCNVCLTHGHCLLMHSITCFNVLLGSEWNLWSAWHRVHSQYAASVVVVSYKFFT